jgi:arogenate dehydrogenase (NADP+)
MEIGIVGLGLIGGSIGLDLRSIGHRVVGVSQRSSTCERAIERGAVDEASTDASILSTCEVVFLCTPLSHLISTVEKIAPFLSKTAILTDVGSVKTPIVRAMTTCTTVSNPFVGGHPMSGTAETGIQAAQSGLFLGNPYVLTPVLTPTEQTPREAVEVVASLAVALGSVLYECSPEAHDRAVALISHLPVMVSASLIQACSAEEDPQVRQLAQQLASSGFRDTSRVGGGNPELGRLMAEFNTPALLVALRRYRSQLDGLIGQIESGQWDALQASLGETQRDRPGYLRE